MRHDLYTLPRIEDQSEFERLVAFELQKPPVKTQADAARYDTMLRQRGIGGAPMVLRGAVWYRHLPPGEVDVLAVFGA